jgi:hypothetical protein
MVAAPALVLIVTSIVFHPWLKDARPVFFAMLGIVATIAVFAWPLAHEIAVAPSDAGVDELKGVIGVVAEVFFSAPLTAGTAAVAYHKVSGRRPSFRPPRPDEGV